MGKFSTIIELIVELLLGNLIATDHRSLGTTHSPTVGMSWT